MPVPRSYSTLTLPASTGAFNDSNPTVTDVDAFATCPGGGWGRSDVNRGSSPVLLLAIHSLSASALRRPQVFRSRTRCLDIQSSADLRCSDPGQVS